VNCRFNFVPLASGNVSNSPSTHETDGNANATEHLEQDQEVEGTGNSMAADKEQVEDVVEAIVEENVEDYWNVCIFYLYLNMLLLSLF
jgi:hypothetical protein